MFHSQELIPRSLYWHIFKTFLSFLMVVEPVYNVEEPCLTHVKYLS